MIRFISLVLVLVLLIVSLAGVGLLAYGARYTDLIFEGVTVQGVDVGGLSREAAQRQVQEMLSDQGMPYVSLYMGTGDWGVSTDTLGGYWELDEAIDEAWALGRSGVYRYDWIERFRLFWWGYDIVPQFHIEPGASLTYLRRVAKQVARPARRAQIWVAGLAARVGESALGRELDIPATRAKVEERVREASGQSGWGTEPRVLGMWRRVSGPSPAVADPIPVPLVFREIVPPLTQVEGAQERVAVILSAPLILTAQLPEVDGTTSTMTWAIDQAVLASWLTLRRAQTAEGIVYQVTIDEALVEAYLRERGDEIARSPRQGRFDYAPETSTLIILDPGQNGYSLDVAEATGRVIAACYSRERQVTLSVSIIEPPVTHVDLEGLMPLQLISEGESSFAGSKPGRLQNIKVATRRFDGLTIPPQGSFSFLDHLGLVTIANGFSESWIIYGDRTIRGPGGGVCQVSTTCFRAAFWGGYPIEERSPHAYRVGWYEPPIGLDAAVFSPVTNMRFRNDTGTPILILTEVDEANAKLYFRFYGQAPTRAVSMDGPVTENPVKAGEPVFDLDPTLAPGQRVQIEWAHDGLDVTLYRIIKVGGETVARERFFSRYDPWPARYRVGPEETPTMDTSSEGAP